MIYKYIDNRSFSNVFIKIFITLILFAMIPISIANIIIYKKAVFSIKQQSYIANMDMLYQSSYGLQQVFKDVGQIITQVSNDSDTINFIINPTSDNLSLHKKMIKKLKNISASNDYILSIYIYSSNNNKIISSSGGVYNSNNFYDGGWLEKYNNIVLGTNQLETRNITDGFGNEFNCITLIRNLPYESWSKLGAVVININEDKLHSTIKWRDNDINRTLFIINREGKVLSHVNKKMLYKNISGENYIKKILKGNRGYFVERVDGRDKFFTYITSPYNGWKFIYEIPFIYIKHDVSTVSNVIIWTTIAAVFVSLLLAYLISKGFYNPVKTLKENVLKTWKFSLEKGEKNKINNEYEFLGEVYSDVINRNKNIRETLEKAKPAIKEKLFTRLITGKIDDIDEIKEKFHLLNLDFSMDNFVAIVMQIDDYKKFCEEYKEFDRNIYKIENIKLVEDLIYKKYKGVCMEVEIDKFILIINYDRKKSISERQHELFFLSQQIQNEVEKSLPYTVTLGIGRVYKDIRNLKKSYKESLKALKYKLYYGKNQVININDLDLQDQELYFYNFESKNMIINNIKVGNLKEVKKLIDDLIKEIKKSNFSYEDIQQIFMRLLTSIVELILNNRLQVEDVFGKGFRLFNEFSKKETIEDMRKFLINVCKKVIEKINEVNSMKNKKNIEELLNYIDENIYRDISLNDLSDFIGLSSSYISKIFKENIGISYSEYINRSRIQRAKQLLKNTNLKIKEIGFKVGYNNVQSFMRTFKKYEKITAGQYREKA